MNVFIILLFLCEIECCHQPKNAFKGSLAINRLLIPWYIGSEALFIESEAARHASLAHSTSVAQSVPRPDDGTIRQYSPRLCHGRCVARFVHSARCTSLAIELAIIRALLKSSKSASDNFDTVSPIASIARSYVYDKASVAAPALCRIEILYANETSR